MVEDYLSDREKEEALREWWRENWRWIVGGIVLGLALLGGWRFWETHRDRRAHEASKLYEDLQASMTKPDLTLVERQLKDLSEEHGASAYVQQGRLLLAKAKVDAGELDAAIALLRTVAAESKDEELARIATLRIARLHIQQGKHDEALKLLDPQNAGGFVAQVREIRGDALFAKGDIEGARKEYAAAIAANSDATVDRTLLELKLQEVGGSPPAGASPGGQR
jgi:predicted negative regulator of RcsB-dependent stress response